MSGFSLPGSRPGGRALVVGSAACRAASMEVLSHLGYGCDEVEDPFTAMAQVCRQPGAYTAIILNLQNLYREELALVGALKQRYPEVEVWLAGTDGRPAALAEATQFGADGLLSEEGLHRLNIGRAVSPPAAERPLQVERSAPPIDPPARAIAPMAPTERMFDEAEPVKGEMHSGNGNGHEPVLSAEELRALLHDPPGEGF